MKRGARRLVRKLKSGSAHKPRFGKMGAKRRHDGAVDGAVDPVPPGTSFARVNSLEVRLARNAVEMHYAQQLRYQVFYEEMSAVPDATARTTKRDADAYDPVCDHLLVLDHAVSETRKLSPWLKKPRVVGTYRLLRQNVAERHNCEFYTQSEFDIAPLIERHGPGLRFLELGRSCVLKPYRTKPTVELLWQGIWSYVRLNQLDVLIGCASLEGTDPDKLALPLSFLHHTALAPEEWRARAQPARYVEMNRMAKDQVNPKTALRVLPPLIKGYLRLGAYIGDGAVLDHQFGTTDVLIILPVSRINARYVAHFSRQDELNVAI